MNSNFLPHLNFPASSFLCCMIPPLLHDHHHPLKRKHRLTSGRKTKHTIATSAARLLDLSISISSVLPTTASPHVFKLQERNPETPRPSTTSSSCCHCSSSFSMLSNPIKPICFQELQQHLWHHKPHFRRQSAHTSAAICCTKSTKSSACSVSRLSLPPAPDSPLRLLHWSLAACPGDSREPSGIYC